MTQPRCRPQRCIRIVRNLAASVAAAMHHADELRMRITRVFLQLVHDAQRCARIGFFRGQQQDASVDVAIRYGGEAPAGLREHGRLMEHFGVYGAPDGIDHVPSPPSLITARWQASLLYEAGWRAWCEVAGVDWLDTAVMRAYDEEYYALQAAGAGQGLALASSVMVAGSVACGLLARYRPDINVPGTTYRVLCVPGRERHPAVKAFLRWLSAELC